MSRQKNRRQIYLIDKTIQYAYLKYIVITIFIVSCFFSFFLITINNYLSDNLMKTVYQTGGGKTMAVVDASELRREMNRRDTAFNVKIILAILILSAFVGYLSIRNSHKIAGPVFRFKETFRRVSAGDLSVRVHLRKGDHLHDLAGLFNQMLDTVENNYKKKE
ncbi:MAG: HAMP domain-containing protein [Candidatus Theseobacter exili]|nr:HAMP domain-containing protein [Candidatus Theseobacter exili]